MQTAASRPMEQSESTLADGRFAAGMDEWEQPLQSDAAEAPLLLWQAAGVSAHAGLALAWDDEQAPSPTARLLIANAQKRSVTRPCGVASSIGWSKGADGRVDEGNRSSTPLPAIT